MTLRSLLGTAFLPILVATAGCSVTSTSGGSPTRDGTTRCGQDATVVGCLGDSTGYACTGGISPEVGNGSLSCSDGTAGANGETLYCCVDVTFPANTCAQDSTVVGCAGTSIGFSCDGGNRPEQTDTTLACSEPTPGGNGQSLYCCNVGGTAPVTTGCTADSSLACASPTTGYSCTGGASPAQADPSLNCSDPSTGAAGSVDYCCSPVATTTTGCAADPSLACASPTSGYSCTGGALPTQADPTLSCSNPSTGTDGSADYCCSPSGTTAPGCAADPAVTGCPAGSSGYSCSGNVSPMSGTNNLLCNPPTAGANGLTDYCCATNSI